MYVNWNPPQPRRGLASVWDKFIGPGATKAEVWLQLAPAVLAGLAAPAYALVVHLGWGPARLIVAGLLALDVVGGILTNATSAAKRWYHRPGQGYWHHLGFIVLHGLHLAVVAWLFRGGDWLFLAVYWAYLVAAAAVVLAVPWYLERSSALLLYVGALLLNIYAVPPTPGMEWFIPLIFLKLLISHTLKEAPFEPGQHRHG